MVVGNMSNITTTNNGLFGCLGGANIQIGFNSSFAGEWSSYAGVSQVGGTIDTNPHAFIFSVGANSAFYVDNSITPISTSTGQTSAIGTTPYFGDSASFAGNIAEAVIIARTITLSERQEFMKYAATRYRLSSC
jgi:hypothetical protein